MIAAPAGARHLDHHVKPEIEVGLQDGDFPEEIVQVRFHAGMKRRHPAVLKTLLSTRRKILHNIHYAK